MAVNTGLGATIAIGSTTSSAPALSDYTNDTYTSIGEVVSIGEFGDSYNAVTFSALSDGRTRKFKGLKDAGTISLVLGFDVNDSGYSALKTALANEDSVDYNFKVTYTDGDDTASPQVTATVQYFSGKVMQMRTQSISGDDVVQIAVDIAINTAITQVDAA